MSEEDKVSSMSSPGPVTKSTRTAVLDIAAVSRAGFEGWHDGRDGTWGGAKHERASRTNWFHPFLFPAIDTAMKKAEWSAGEAVKILQRERPELYSSLHRGTVWKWKEEGQNKWSHATEAKIQKRHALLASG